jgi:hypothetical protein
MYRITNKALNGINVKAMEEQELEDLCAELGVLPAYLHENENVPQMITGFDVLNTQKKILNNFCFSYYMDLSYFRQEHKALAEKRKLKKTLSKATSGADTYTAFADLGLGFYRLLPGQSVDIDVNKLWITDYLSKQAPFRMGLLVIEDLSTNEEIKPVELEPDKEITKKSSKDDYRNMKWIEMKAFAKGLGIEQVNNKTRIELLSLIEEKLK